MGQAGHKGKEKKMKGFIKIDGILINVSKILSVKINKETKITPCSSIFLQGKNEVVLLSVDDIEELIREALA